MWGWLKRIGRALVSPTGRSAEKFVMTLTADVVGAKLGTSHPAVAAATGAVSAALSGDKDTALQDVVLAVHEVAGIKS